MKIFSHIRGVFPYVFFIVQYFSKVWTVKWKNLP